jgi:hypothetical protein
MPKADVSEERIVISECGQRSTDWWNTLLDKLKAHHIPGRYQDGKRMWADSRGNAIIYFTSDTVSPDEAVKMLERAALIVSSNHSNCIFDFLRERPARECVSDFHFGLCLEASSTSVSSKVKFQTGIASPVDTSCLQLTLSSRAPSDFIDRLQHFFGVPLHRTAFILSVLF